MTVRPTDQQTNHVI